MMRNLITKIMLMASLLSIFGCKGNNDPSSWNEEKTNEWFNKGEWRNGWAVTPDNSINRKSLAVNYFNHKQRWDSVFIFLKDNDLASLEPGRYDVDGNNAYVTITDYKTKNEEDANFEAHRKYIDIQYVIEGKELINITPISSKTSEIQAYDPAKDIEFFSVNETRTYNADPGIFFVFFPEDAHRPSLKVDTIAPVRKMVVKVRID